MRGSRHPRAPSPTNTPPPTPSLTGNPTVDNWLQLFTENEIDNMYRDFAPLLSRNSRQMLRSNEERALDSSNASSREPAASSVRSTQHRNPHNLLETPSDRTSPVVLPWDNHAFATPEDLDYMEQSSTRLPRRGRGSSPHGPPAPRGRGAFRGRGARPPVATPAVANPGRESDVPGYGESNQERWPFFLRAGARPVDRDSEHNLPDHSEAAQTRASTNARPRFADRLGRRRPENAMPDLSLAYDDPDDLPLDEQSFSQAWSAVPTAQAQAEARELQRLINRSNLAGNDYEETGLELQRFMAGLSHPRSGVANRSLDDSELSATRSRLSAMKRSRDRFEGLNGKTSTTDILKNREAVALLLYRTETPDPTANDIWPNFRNAAKLPVTYTNLDENYQAPKETRTKRRFGKTSKSNVAFPKVQGFRRGRPEWRLPVELFEEVAGYLNRDDIKSMRLVSQELNSYVSQVIFKTVVVPFNTEIYGMLGQDPKPDLKGKKKVKIGTPGFFWKNSNGDDVYNGHGLDVFKGFGQHILKFGMSFEVSEDALSKPLLKSVTEQHTSFWGSYHWPFEDYRRFDDVAGLECAADETPRMKLAFSELSKVTELALSVDSGLGWLNGPDQSIRARVLQKPPVVFGTLKQIPDRRSQAQKELWDYIQSCHQAADVDVKLAMLYKMEAHKSLLDSLDANMPAREQPSMPFLDPQLVNEAALLHAADIQLPTASEEADVLESSFLAPAGSSTGILFSSATQPTITERFIYPITPTNLTQAQEEWLLETEWAQRAFLSSYMLAIIDNPTTFHRVHTLNIARLSDRYIPTLSRADFWNALPSLRAVTLLVLPGWRTVHKSEAGFVNTQKIDPASGIDSVYEMLKNIVSHRQNIKKLTLGWAHGGEHAQGFFARNKLLLPAPIMVADKAVEHRPKIISQSMLRFSHVEELTLKNCWVTPSALLQLVTEHDSLSLEKLVLDSVSLTAPLTPGPPHANAPPINPAPNNQMAPFGGNAPGPQNQANPMQLLHFHIQALQLQIQQLQITGGGQQGQLAMLQAQLQNQLQLQAQLQNQVPLHLQLQQHAPAQLPHQPPNQAQNNAPVQYVGGMWVPHHPFPVPAMPAVAVAATPDPRSTLMGKPRPGSWVNILDIVSPGPNLADFGSEFSQAIEERNTSLQAIEFISCGYAKLPNTTFDQTAIERQVPSPRNTAMIKRMLTLTPAMLSSKWPLMGEIVQEVNMEELLALQAGWHMEMGWKNAEEAQAVEFDAQLPGGTGRFSGVVRASDRVTEASANDGFPTEFFSKMAL